MKRGLNSVSSLFIVLSLCLAMQGMTHARETTGGYPPLFNVELDKPFPEPAKTFDEVRQLILQKYYSTRITEDALYHAAIQGMLAHISPPSNRQQASLWTAATYDAVHDNLLGEQVSIGIRSKFDTHDGSLTVTEVLSGSAADGRLHIGDRIMRINGQRLRSLNVSRVNQLLNGEDRSPVELVVVRDIEVLTIKLTLQRFKLQNLLVSQLPDGITLIEVHKVDKDISTTLHSALEKLKTDRVKSLIIDLRNNSGGVFAEGLRMAELFLPARHILMRLVRKPDQLQNFVSAEEQPFDMKLAVLTNKKTASAAEIMAASLQAHGRAQLIGTSTYGKATLEETFTLSNNYRVKFIIGAMYDPRGRTWQDRGLQPDYYIHQQISHLPSLAKLAIDKRLEKDTQLKAAWNLLKKNQ